MLEFYCSELDKKKYIIHVFFESSFTKNHYTS
jgi:hypothetical protein